MDIAGKYREVAETINSAGGTPLPVNDTLVEIIKMLVEEDEIIHIFFQNWFP